jgi:hypothetical protein
MEHPALITRIRRSSFLKGRENDSFKTGCAGPRNAIGTSAAAHGQQYMCRRSAASDLD